MKFQLGQTVMTRGVNHMVINGFNPLLYLARHERCDWGNMSADDMALNDLALTDGSRIFSAYKTPEGKIWIITEAVGDDDQRAATTILLPEEY